jgi:hypothetical protein
MAGLQLLLGALLMKEKHPKWLVATANVHFSSPVLYPPSAHASAIYQSFVCYKYIIMDPAKIAEFKMITGVDDAKAREYLTRANWNTEVRFNLFMKCKKATHRWIQRHARHSLALKDLSSLFRFAV